MNKLLGSLFGPFLFAALAEVGGYILSQKSAPSGLTINKGTRLDATVFTLKPKYSQRWTTDEFDISVRTNSGGFREDKDFRLNDIDVAFCGDSFTFGLGVDVDQRYTNIFAKHFPAQRVANLAYICGYEPEHYEYYFN